VTCPFQEVTTAPSRRLLLQATQSYSARSESFAISYPYRNRINQLPLRAHHDAACLVLIVLPNALSRLRAVPLPVAHRRAPHPERASGLTPSQAVVIDFETRLANYGDDEHNIAST